MTVFSRLVQAVTRFAPFDSYSFGDGSWISVHVDKRHQDGASVRVFYHLKDGSSVVCLEVADKWQTFLYNLSLDAADSEVGLSIGCLPMFFHIGFESWSKLRPLYQKLGMKENREVRVQFVPYGEDCGTGGPYLSWSLGQDPGSWEWGTPWWRYGSVHAWDVLFGDTRMVDDKIGPPVGVVVQMPEAAYVGTAQRNHSKWVRSRWPGVWHERFWWNLKFPDGIPFPSKGENAWDLDDDAVFETGSSEPNLKKAVEEFVNKLLERRERIGGKNWRPSPKVDTQDPS